MVIPNRPQCVDFELGADKTPSAEEVFDLAAKARNAGYLIEQSELEEASGYTLEKDAQQPQPGPAFGIARAREPAPPLQKPKTPLQNAPKKPDGQGEGQEPAALLGAFLRTLQEDCKPLADAVEKLIADGCTPEAAKDLLAHIGDYLPADPAAAAVLAEDTARAFAEAWEAARPDNPDIPENPVVAAAKSGECRSDDPAHCPTHGTSREHRDKGFQDRYGNGNPETLAANPEMNIERGKAVFTRLARKQTGDEPHAMYREGLGWIGVEAGTAGNPRPYDGPNEKLKGRTFLGGSGIAHILAKHPGAEKHIAETLQHGEMFRNLDNATGKPNERKITIIHGNNVAIVSKHRDGRLLITNFFEDKPEKIEALKVLGRYHVRGENK